jgi:hypothetical protein
LHFDKNQTDAKEKKTSELMNEIFHKHGMPFKRKHKNLTLKKIVRKNMRMKALQFCHRQ